MKTIGFRDISGGPIKLYHNPKERQTRQQRIKTALKELNHTANVVVYLVDGKKVKRLCVKRYDQFSEVTKRYMNQ